MGLELYLDLLSQPCRSVYLFAQKNGIPFEFKHVDLTKAPYLGREKETPSRSGLNVPEEFQASQLGKAQGDGRCGGRHSKRQSRQLPLAEQTLLVPFSLLPGQHREEAFAKVSMLQKVPVLKDGDFTLAESIAILLYLARKFKTPDHWYPSDLQKRARVDEYLSWQHTGTRMSGSKVFLLKGLVPLFLDKPLPPEKLQEAIEELNGTLKTFEEKFLQDRPFIVGDEISLADLVAIVELMQPVAVGHDIFDGRPKMSAWRHRVEDAIGKDLFLESHKLLFGYKDKTADQIPPDMKEKLLPIVLKYVK